jgi:hypothetical protein
VQGIAINGSATASPFSFSFGTKDNVAPRLLGASPPAIDGVPGGSSPTLVFSEPMDHASVEAAFSVVDVTDGNLAVPCGSFSWSGDSIVTCNWASPAPSTRFRATLSGAATDKSGNPILFSPSPSPYAWEFVTQPGGAAPDSTPPIVLSATASGQSVNPPATIHIVFSESMRPGTVQLSTEPEVSGALVWSDTSNTSCDFIPDGPWPYGQQVNFTVSSGAQDLSGNTMAGSYNGGFRTLSLKQVVVPVELDQLADSGFVFASPPPDGSQVAWGAPIRVGSWGFGATPPSPGCDALTANDTARGFVSFRLPEVGNLVGATLQMYATETDGNLAELGNLEVEGVTGPTLVAGSFDAPAIAGDGVSVLPSVAGGNPLRQGDVTSQVLGASARRDTQGGIVQLRLRWDVDSIGYRCFGPNDTGYQLDGARSNLVLSYESP